MQDLLKRLASGLVASALNGVKQQAVARVNGELDKYLEVAAAKLEADSNLPEFVTKAVAFQLRSSEVRTQLHLLVAEEIDQLIAQLTTKLNG